MYKQILINKKVYILVDPMCDAEQMLTSCTEFIWIKYLSVEKIVSQFRCMKLYFEEENDCVETENLKCFKVCLIKVKILIKCL